MWTAQDILQLPIEGIQKRIGFTISKTELANYVGNLTLAPDVLPTEIRSKHIMHAIFKEYLSKNRKGANSEEFYIPEEIYRYCANDTEALLIALDSYLLPDICLIKKHTEEIPLAMIVQIKPLNRLLKGICIFDYGLSEKQTLHLSAQSLVRVPVAERENLEILFAITKGITSIQQRKKIPIISTKLGLVIDTRDSDILIESSLSQSRKLVSEWHQSFDVQIQD